MGTSYLRNDSTVLLGKGKKPGLAKKKKSQYLEVTDGIPYLVQAKVDPLNSRLRKNPGRRGDEEEKRGSNPQKSWNLRALNPAAFGLEVSEEKRRE